MDNVTKFFIYTGVIILLIGIISWFLAKMGISIGKLPGDMSWGGEGFSIYFPIVSTILISVILTIIVNVLFWLMRK